MKKLLAACCVLCVLCNPVSAAYDGIHHELRINIDPARHYLEGVDRLTIPADQVGEHLCFLLASGLEIISETPGVTVELERSGIRAGDFGMDVEDFSLSSSKTQNRYLLKFSEMPKGDIELTLRYEGSIYFPVERVGEEYARGFSQSSGIISEEGVYLGGSTYWVPWFNDRLISFELTTVLPEGWDTVSQGERTLHEIRDGNRVTCWNSAEPMEEIYLIAAEFNEYSMAAGAVRVMAFLRTPDENLAARYLETTAQYLDMYRKLVGPYPFSKFALVENFWETGYGMPSFTLLGEKVIRFPFILHSSYPHELLHNWWGNSVYVDFDFGNWCEGITVYMADHLIKEQRGRGMEYRRSTLQKFTDYVTDENDFPLTGFLSRNNASSEAIGYGKCMMVWNMLRDEVGDEKFVQGFQAFYRNNRYKKASFDDIRLAFESVTERDFRGFFDQWIKRTGAPELRLSDVRTNHGEKGYELQFILEQVQKEDFFNLNVPVVVSFSESVKAIKVSMTARKQTFRMTFLKKPLLVRIDPQFNIMRKLHYNEIPPALSKIFGAGKILILLPSAKDKAVGDRYRRLAEIWKKDTTKKVEIMMDDEAGELPASGAVWVFGEKNIYRSIIEAGIKGYDAEISNESVRINKTVIEMKNNSIIMAVRHPADHNSVAVWLTIGNEDAAPGLSVKLPHYGKYSYLAFEGAEPGNIAKGQWKVVDSPLVAVTGRDSGKEAPPGSTDLPVREALASLAPVFSVKRMMEDVRYLASDELEGRGPGSEGIDKAAEYIADRFREAGLKPGADDGTFFQVWEDVIDGEGNRGEVRNVIGIIPGTDEKMKGESVVVCAHYDHLGRGWPDVRKGNEGKIHYGADDNASGVAVMIELARLLGKTLVPRRTLVFAAFTSEEDGLRGSRYYVRNHKILPADRIMGALNLDTVGRLNDNKLMVINSSSAREWKFIFLGAGYVTGVEAEMVSQDLDASDQGAFIEAGVPAVQFFSGPHSDYHRPTDTADKIDPSGMVKVATFVREAILHLAGREEPLSFSGEDRKEGAAVRTPGRRKASTGSMPDFSYSGEGVRIGAVTTGSPADKAGLTTGDVIIRFGRFNVINLQDYSNALKEYEPGNEVEIIYLRDGSREAATVKLTWR